MRLKSSRGVLAHNFDTDYILKLIEDGSLEHEDAIAILNNAVTVILTLRSKIKDTSYQINVLKSNSDSMVSHEYMKGQK